ncbi:NACHT domain-containing protein [Leptolyngbya ectocarpi]|uniref:NACHT domain-containing protein n=1 Tax=Leptolyngbya ectocarpi TaxID=1202 RepID=UPI002AD5466F|nr:NACHT domain-containing NTPase [Leptolyngbya ectocarpi]
MGRSLKTCPAGIKQAEIALTSKGWSREDLADQVVLEGKKTTQGIGIQTVKKFFAGKQGVDRKYFVAICKTLALEWEVIAGMKKAVLVLPQEVQDIDALVRKVRQQVGVYIKERCGTMRVLDMTQPIGIEDIYTSVNILNKLTGRRRLDMSELLENFKLEDFDRFGLGPIVEKRVPGIAAVQKYNKLMVLGKPGAGKTTFLKYLAIQCNEGEFQADCAPVFITLKDFADARNQPDLLTFILSLVSAFSADDFLVMLQAGKVLLLLDGLDEVREEYVSQVRREIQTLADQYPENQFVVTCRIAAQDYVFQQFTEVEVADFDEQQIAEFANRWFRLKYPAKAESFIAKLQEEKRIQELATNPLLLTLLCLIFEEKGKFKDSRAELYKEGIELLLEKWDDSRDINRDQVYRKLSTNRKENLLSQIAFTAFAKSEYFFKQETLEQLISAYIQNLPDAQTDPEALLIRSGKVLKSIEAQHGLFVERANYIYSFSHLTLQEYFTARDIVVDRRPDALNKLVSRITEKRWREVFLLTAEMLREADYLLESMKLQIDNLLAGDNQLQKFLIWVKEKSDSVKVAYKPAAVRAFYFAFALARARNLARERALARALDHAYDRDRVRALARSLDRALDRVLDIALDYPRALAYDLALAGDLAGNLDRELDRAIARAYSSDPELNEALQTLKDNLPEKESDLDEYNHWWQTQGEAWAEDLRVIMIEHRNIGHDWQFSDEQKEKLKQYYDANKLLVDCLNSDCYITRLVREKIETTLLLPLTT